MINKGQTVTQKHTIIISIVTGQIILSIDRHNDIRKQPTEDLLTLVSSKQFVISGDCCLLRERIEDVHVKDVTVILLYNPLKQPYDTNSFLKCNCNFCLSEGQKGEVQIINRVDVDG